MSTFVHGIIDYLTSATMASLPSLLGWKGVPRTVLQVNAAAAAVYSSCTNYELGIAKVLPMKAHLAMDAASGCMLIGTGLLLDDEEPEVRSTLIGLGIFELAASLTTQTHSPAERERQRRAMGRFPVQVSSRGDRRIPALSSR